MPEPVTKRLNVTFHTGLPLGTRANFTLDGERWIALPDAKYVRILAITDRLVGALGAVQQQLVAWLATNPGDTTRIGMLLATIARTDELRQEATIEKTVAATL